MQPSAKCKALPRATKMRNYGIITVGFENKNMMDAVLSVVGPVARGLLVDATILKKDIVAEESTVGSRTRLLRDA